MLIQQFEYIFVDNFSHIKFAYLCLILIFPDKSDADQTEAKDNKKEELLRQKKEELELRRESARKRHVRPWDRDKSTLNTSHCSEDDDAVDKDWKPMTERRVMSQGEI